MRRTRRSSESGFTLPELLVAITILGIVMVAIGAMITTSFRTSETVAAELQGSRGPKVVSRFWVPDVEQAESINTELPCGDGDAVVTFVSHLAPSAFATPADAAEGLLRRVTWSEVPGPRDQLVRFVCDDGAPSEQLVVVSDLKVKPTLPVVPAPRHTIEVTVPDKSRPNDVYIFTVTATSQVTTTTSTP